MIRPGALAALIVLLLAALPAGAQAAPFAVATGERPSVAVDEFGTGHVVWNEDRPLAAGGAVTAYCRIPRGARACGPVVRLPFEGTFETATPRAVIARPGEVWLVSSRLGPAVGYDQTTGAVDTPTCLVAILDRCTVDSRYTVIWQSFDDGRTFQAPQIAAMGAGGASGDAALVLRDGPAGPASLPALATVTSLGGNGTQFQEVAPGEFSPRSTLVSLGDANQAVDGTVATQGARRPVAAFGDIGGRVFVRRWNGGGAPADPGAWETLATLDGVSAPRMAGGDRTWLMTIGDATRRVELRQIIDRTVTPPQAISSPGGGQPAKGDLFQDEAGTLYAAWPERRAGAADELVLRVRARDDIGPRTVVGTAPASSIHHVEIAAADDGGGFAVWSSNLAGTGTISVAPFGTTARRAVVDVRVDAIELNQGVQLGTLPARPADPRAPIPYTGVQPAARKGGVVRVYASAREGTGTPVAPLMRLRATRRGRPISPAVVYPRALPATLPPGPRGEVTPAERLSATVPYTFDLPLEWTLDTGGDVTIEAEINPEGVSPAVTECRRCREDNTARLVVPAFRRTTRVTVMPLMIFSDALRPPVVPADAFAGARQALPFPIDVQPYQAVWDLDKMLPNLPSPEARSDFLAARTRDWADEHRPESRYFVTALLPTLPSGREIRGQNTGVLYSDTQAVAVMEPTRPLRTVTHELGHAIGLPHAGLACGGNSDGQIGEPWPPDDTGWIGDAVGIDRRTPAPYRVVAPGTAGAPDASFDVMSYCGGGEPSTWVSPRTWDRAVAFRAPAQPRVAPRAAMQARQSGRSVRVVATVRGEVVTPVLARPSRSGPTAAGPGPYALVARDAAGGALGTFGVRATPLTEGGGTLLEGWVPAGAASVDVVVNGRARATLRQSRSAPTVRILSPSRGNRVGSRATVTVRYRARDADGDRLEAGVEYSSDGGRTWSGVALGAADGTAAIPSRLLPASSRARVRVRVRDGFREAVATSAPFTSLGAPPQVTISSPVRGDRVAAGGALTLTGTAFDDAGRALRGRALTWRAGRRVLGHGPELALSRGLPAGRAAISLEARDARGRRARAATRLTVIPARPVFLRLTPPRTVSATARRVTVTLAASVPSVLRVGGVRRDVDQRTSRITVPIRAGRGPLRLTFELRSGPRRTRVPVVIRE